MVTTFGKFIPKTDLIMSQIINVFSEMVSNASRGNEGWNEYIFMHIKHMRNYTIPKEYETILSKPNEVIDFCGFLLFVFRKSMKFKTLSSKNTCTCGKLRRRTTVWRRFMTIVLKEFPKDLM